MLKHPGPRRDLVGSPSARIQPVVGRPGSGKTYAASACVQAFAASGVPVIGCAVSAIAAAELEHAYARTTYGVQGATLDRARYHPSDASRLEEGYVAITRATDAVKLYVVDGDLGLDEEDDPRAIEPERSGLSTVIGARSNLSPRRMRSPTRH